MAYSTASKSNATTSGIGTEEWSPDLDPDDLRELQEAQHDPSKIVVSLPKESVRMGYFSTLCLLWNRMIGKQIKSISQTKNSYSDGPFLNRSRYLQLCIRCILKHAKYRLVPFDMVLCRPLCPRRCHCIYRARPDHSALAIRTKWREDIYTPEW
jgi:hypothetical protein